MKMELTNGKVYWSHRSPRTDEYSYLSFENGSLFVTMPIFLCFPIVDFSKPHISLYYSDIILKRLKPHIQKTYKPNNGEISAVNIIYWDTPKQIVRHIDGTEMGYIITIRIKIQRITS